MPLAQLQAALARILTDESLRNKFLEFQAEPGIPAELDGYQLSSSDLQSLLAIRHDRLRLYAHLLRDKRIGKVHDILPWTWALLRPKLHDLMKAYCQQYPPVTISKLEEAETFYSFLRQQHNRIEPSYALDVALYEVTLASFSQLRVRHALPGAGPVAFWSPDLYCARKDGVKILTFEHRMMEILLLLEKDQLPQYPQRDETHVLFVPVTDRVTPQAFEISAVLAKLLTACDGRSTVADMARAVAHGQGGNDGRQAYLAVSNMFLQLFEGGVVELWLQPLADPVHAQSSKRTSE
jgi:hypothetical protein